MHFNRKTAIGFSILLFIVCMAFPIVSALYLSWLQAINIERDKLFSTVKLVIQRTRICLDEVYGTFDELDDHKFTACSPLDIQKMQDMVFNKHCVDEIQYSENDKVKCDSSGTVHNNMSVSSAGFIMPNGSSISAETSNFINYGYNLIKFTQGDYALSVDKNSLTDLITEPYIKIALITDDGQVLSTLHYYNAPSQKLIETVLKNDNLKNFDNHLIAVYRIPGLYYIISEPKSYVVQQWHKSLVLFFPFGLFMSLFLCATVIWGLRRRLSALGELKIAIERREFVVYYQPIIDFKTGACIGAESLIRWQKPDGTMVRPDLFIPLAENSGLIQAITDQLIESIITNLKNILNKDRNLHISINIPVVDFNSKRIFKKLESTMTNTGIDPKQIWLEITERGFINFDAALDSLNEARKLGYVIVIDDFGTGYSSLSYLKELPINVLKIDKSFVDSVNTDSVTSNVTQHIIDLAKDLHLQIVAEGVENSDQVNYLKARDVDFAQGWFYAKAMPLDKFLSFYTDHSNTA